MIARLIDWSARNLMLVLIGAVFAVASGVYALQHSALDAIPDLSDTQVIVYTDYKGQAPQVIEDQVTYPLTTAMLTVPKSKVVRGFSFFGVSFVYIIFEDGTDIYWARSRVLEYLSAAARKLPNGVTPTLGPDATGVGWVYQYALQSKDKSLADLRSLQDWTIRYGIAKAEGVAEVASVGGFVKQYNIIVDPNRLRSLNIPLAKVRDAVRGSNMDVGGRTVELSEFEFVVRGRGYVKSIADLSNIVLKVEKGTPVLLKDVARIELGPDERRGITELNGEGEVASGIALQRFGQNALDVIDNVKARLADMASALPKGVEIIPVYDRSNLIHNAIETLKRTLTEESIVVALVCIVFLLHVRSALVAIVMLPVGILMAFGAMKVLGIGSNIMSLGGIAIAIGAMIDGAIVMIENAHKHLERAPPDKPRLEVLIEAASEVGPALFFSLLIITVSFLPIFTMESQEGSSVQPVGLHQNVRDGSGRDPVDHPGSGSHGAVHSRQDHSRAQKSDQSVPDLGLSAPDPWSAEGQDADNLSRACCLGGHPLAGPATRNRVHAEPGRRHADVYADDVAGTFGDQGGRDFANAEQAHQDGSRSRLGLRQGRARGDCDRSRADRDV